MRSLPPRPCTTALAPKHAVVPNTRMPRRRWRSIAGLEVIQQCTDFLRVT